MSLRHRVPLQALCSSSGAPSRVVSSPWLSLAERRNTKIWTQPRFTLSNFFTSASIFVDFLQLSNNRMALIVLSGLPCSGKSSVAEAIAADLRARDTLSMKIQIVNDETVNVQRTAYATQKSEKPARAAILAAVARSLARDTIVICDGMNYIKGFRYQLFCAAREINARVCTVSQRPVPASRRAQSRCRYIYFVRQVNAKNSIRSDNSHIQINHTMIRHLMSWSCASKSRIQPSDGILRSYRSCGMTSRFHLIGYMIW